MDLDDVRVLRRVIANSASLCALHDDAVQLDLMTSISGFSYRELAEGATHFSISNVDVRVGRLGALLRSKQLSGRPKDLESLRAFEARALEDDEEGA